MNFVVDPQASFDPTNAAFTIHFKRERAGHFDVKGHTADDPGTSMGKNTCILSPTTWVRGVRCSAERLVG